MKVGILGGTGMIGHHTAIATIKAGHELVVIHRTTSNLDRIRDLTFNSRIGDLQDATSLTSAFKGLDWVINCAAYYPTKPRSVKLEMATAGQQTKNFIHAVSSSGIKKALYLGGSIVIPRAESGLGTEDGVYDDAPPNKAPYIQVKWLMDKMIREAGQNGVPIVIGIPTMTFGEYDYGPTTGKLVVDIANKNLPAYVRGNRNIIYAGDAGRGLLLACEKGRKGARYLLTGENISMDDLVTKISRHANVPPPPNVLPLTVAKAISWLQETRYKLFKGKLPQLSSTAIAVLSAGQFIDGLKAKKELGYAPSLDLDQTIDKTINWFRSEGYIRS